MSVYEMTGQVSTKVNVSGLSTIMKYTFALCFLMIMARWMRMHQPKRGQLDHNERCDLHRR